MKHAPTDKIWADMLTKSLQRKNYKATHSGMMNVNEDYDEKKECVATQPMLLPEDNSQEELKQSIQVLVTTKLAKTVQVSNPITNRTEVKMRSGKCV